MFGLISGTVAETGGDVPRFIQADPITPQPFEGCGLHIHQHPEQPAAETLIVFVHGWSGGGYSTWAQLPSALYRDDTLKADVGLFDYVSGLRRRPRNNPDLDLVVLELLDEIRDLTGYRHLAFVCHSMGGQIATAALRRSFERHDGDQALPGRTSCLITLGSPRAGTKWVLTRYFPTKDQPYLLLHGSIAGLNNQFLTNYVDISLEGELTTRTFHIPHFVGVGSADGVVDVFSAGFSIPDGQKRAFRGNHSGFLKHVDLAGWVTASIRAGRAGTTTTRQQNRRQAVPPMFTRFKGHSLRGDWQDAYEQALTEFSQESTGPVVDITGAPPGKPVSLLMRVLRCEDVADGSIRDELLEIKAANESNQIHTVGLSPHGDRSDARAQEVFDLLGSSESRWIKGTEDLAGLKSEMVTWLRRSRFLVASHEPRYVGGSDNYSFTGSTDIDDTWGLGQQ